MTYDEFEQDVKRRVEVTKPGFYSEDGTWQDDDRIAKITPHEDIALVYTGMGGAITDGKAYIGFEARQEFSLDEESAAEAALLIIDCLNGKRSA